MKISLVNLILFLPILVITGCTEINRLRGSMKTQQSNDLVAQMKQGIQKNGLLFEVFYFFNGLVFFSRSSDHEQVYVAGVIL